MAGGSDGSGDVSRKRIEIMERIAAGERTGEIAAAVGCSVAYVSALRHHTDTLQFKIMDEVLKKRLILEASKRRMYIGTFVKKLLDVIVRDNLFDAVLDDQSVSGGKQCEMETCLDTISSSQ